jgi:hypothetical protein
LFEDDDFYDDFYDDDDDDDDEEEEEEEEDGELMMSLMRLMSRAVDQLSLPGCTCLWKPCCCGVGRCLKTSPTMLWGMSTTASAADDASQHWFLWSLGLQGASSSGALKQTMTCWAGCLNYDFCTI